MIGKFVTFIIIFIIVYFMLVSKFRKKTKKNKIINLKKCFKCGTFFDEEEMVKLENKYLCKRCFNADNRT